MRRYKTVIEVVTEAEDQFEAVDIAGEYLRGNISNGVSMRCSAYPLQKCREVFWKILVQFL